MKEKTIELFDGINLHIIKTDKFKTNLLAVFMLTDLNRENVTKNTLIPAVLRRGTTKLQTMKDIAIKLEDMYGSILDASSEKMGDKQVLQFYIDSLANEYTLDNCDVLKDATELLCDVILDPLTEDVHHCTENSCTSVKTFKSEYVEQEKETIKELINAKINDKGSYAINRATEEMCKDEPYGLYKFGYVEDLKDITAQKLYNQYKNILATSEIHIYVSGNVDEKEIEGILKNKFQIVSRKYEPINNEITNKNDKVTNYEQSNIVTEKQNVTQGKLVLGYRAQEINLIDDMYKMAMYSAVLGGTASSKLFMNVREKESLAYTVRSMYLKHKGIMMVTAGIEIDKYNKALECIKREIEDMKLGNITDEEVEDARANLITVYKSFNDKQASIINLYMGQRFLGVVEDIETILKKIKDITKEDIVEVANKLNLEITYFLTNN